MTRFSKVGHHFIVGLSGPALSDLDKKILDDISPAGVLLLKRNFLQEAPYHDWLEVLERLLKGIKEYAGREKLIISIDHEGGRVHRTPPPITQFPDAIQCTNHAYDVAKAMAVELRSIGINLSWSPVCDIHSNPQNPVIGKRAFGHDTKTVSDACSQFARGLLENGVIACAKHFPGHGDTSVDSHKELPVLHATLDELEKRELVPFKRLINEGIPLVMTSHILFPKIDGENPATLSSTILQKILRDSLGFGGIIVTDDLDMNAVSLNRAPSSLVTDAFRAGCELFIVARHPDGSSDKPLTMAHALSEAANKDKTLGEKFLLAQEKILLFLNQSAGSYSITELPKQTFENHRKLKETITSIA